MTRALVTGAAGFIGSHLTEFLLAQGYAVTGVDCFTDYYDPGIKRRNLFGCHAAPAFELAEVDLRDTEISLLLEDVDIVFHQAAQPGVRLSWAEHFPTYDSHNIRATQRLLEAARIAEPSPVVVIASSSSVYGNARRYPTTEEDEPRPYSPYGVTKLAAEALARAYAANWGLRVVSLRYFTVYGPRQRPDMAIHRVIDAALRGAPFTLHGDGRQVRDFTFVSDVVAANLAAAELARSWDGRHRSEDPAPVVNVAGGTSITMLELISLVEELVGAAVKVERSASQPGDVRRTGGSVDRAMEVLGWAPRTSIREGLERQVQWHRDLLENPEVDALPLPENRS